MLSVFISGNVNTLYNAWWISIVNCFQSPGEKEIKIKIPNNNNKQTHSIATSTIFTRIGNCLSRLCFFFAAFSKRKNWIADSNWWAKGKNTQKKLVYFCLPSRSSEAKPFDTSMHPINHQIVEWICYCYCCYGIYYTYRERETKNSHTFLGIVTHLPKKKHEWNTWLCKCPIVSD